MPRLTYQTAGESHGPTMLAVINGLPAGLELDVNVINRELERRQGGYGRGGRQRIERDVAEFLTGVRRGRTIGSPLTVQVINRDVRLDDLTKTPAVHRPRPGHADLAGSVKWLTTDCRETLERASARETSVRVGAGAIARCFLREFGIEVFGFVRSIHQVETDVDVLFDQLDALIDARDTSEVYCPDADASQRMIDVIRQTKVDKDTVGGIVEAHIFNCPIGIGSCMNWYDKLDSRLAGAVMGIQAFKGVEIGLGFEATRRLGSQVHDPIAYDRSKRDTTPAIGFTRASNNAGGLEGGMTNGMPIIVRGAMKPISTILKGMPSVDLNTKKAEMSQYERSDICAVSAASVVMENVVAFEVAAAFVEKFSGDSMRETRANYESFLAVARSLPLD